MTTDTLTPTELSCYHCGDTCVEGAVYLDDKPFCCEGCKTVFELLNDNELTNYYCLETQPGTSLKRSNTQPRFDYLEDPSVVERLVDFKNNRFTAVTLYIPNIHCTSCVWLLEKLYRLDGGITQSSVNFLKRELSVSFDEGQTSLRSIVELLASIGYEPELRLDRLERNTSSSPNRRLWLKLGVAGFAFGNIMLFSFPEYLSGSTLNNSGSFHIFFGILNVVLALPVVIYSSGDYLKSAWAAIRQGGINLDVPISIGILSLFGRSLYEIITGIGPGYMDSLTGLVFFLLIGRIIQKKTYERLSFDRDYKSYLPISITVINEQGEETSTSIDALKEGTTMLIRNQELVPADSVLLSENCFIDYSFITGESEPVEVRQGETIYAGGKVIGPSVKMNTVKEVSSSYLTKLWNTAFDEHNSRKNVTSLADRISPHFTLAVLGIATAAGILWWSVNPEMSVSVFTAVLIIACPCALALSTPFTLGSALNIFSQNGLYIKGIEVIERLANAGSLVFDKTGTLTKADEAEVFFHGAALAKEEESLIKSACRQSVHPLSRKVAAHFQGLPDRPVQQFEEEVNKGISADVAGHSIVVGSASFVAQKLGGASIEKFAAGETTSTVHIAIDDEWKGWFEIANAYRPGIRELLADFKEHFSTYLISGDNDSQKQQFAPYFEAASLRFNQTPQQKLDFITNLQDSDQSVVMIGDGLNDAGALQQSDFGIALTENVSSFTPACDAILDGASLNKLGIFIDYARSSISIIKLSFGISLIYNLVGLGFAVSGQLTPLMAAILMPLSSISIMLFTTASAYITAKKMGLDTWK